MSNPWWVGPDRGWESRAESRALCFELGRLVGSALVDGRGGPPDVELERTEDGWRVVARLPGVAPEEVAVELDDRELCVRDRSEAEVNTERGMGGTGSRTRGFEYRISLPSGFDQEKVDAVMDHGLLTVTLPRLPSGARRTITIGSPRYGPGRSVSVRGGERDTTGKAGKPHPVDPAADREMHHPDVQPGERDRWLSG
jgi:HSP20 family protein